jgi:hypothetical protein
MRLARFAWVAPMLFLCVADPATAGERYKLGFKQDGLKRLALTSPMGHGSSYWYLTYQLTNHATVPVKEPPITIWATTDTPWDFRDGLVPLAYHQINYHQSHRNCPDWCPGVQHYAADGTRKSREQDWMPERGKPLLTYRDVRAEGFEIAPDETVECLAIFSLHGGRDLRGLTGAMNLFTQGDHKAGLELLRATLQQHPEGEWNAWVRELLTAADGGLDGARSKTDEMRERWNKQKKAFIPSAEGEGADFDLLNDAVHLLRTREYEAALEKLNAVLTEHPESRFRRDADHLRTLAARRRVEEMDAWIERYLYGHQPHRLKNEADDVRLHVNGLWDVVFSDGSNVYRETRILEVHFVRPGSDLYPDQLGFRLEGTREYVEEGERQVVRKTWEDRGTK